MILMINEDWKKKKEKKFQMNRMLFYPKEISQPLSEQ